MYENLQSQLGQHCLHSYYRIAKMWIKLYFKFLVCYMTKINAAGLRDGEAHIFTNKMASVKLQFVFMYAYLINDTLTHIFIFAYIPFI